MQRIPLIGFCLLGNQGLDHASLRIPRGRPRASWLSQVESYLGRDGPGVCLGDAQMEAEGVPSLGGRDDALLRRMSQHLK